MTNIFVVIVVQLGHRCGGDHRKEQLYAMPVVYI